MVHNRFTHKPNVVRDVVVVSLQCLTRGRDLHLQLQLAGQGRQMGNTRYSINQLTPDILHETAICTGLEE